MCINLKEVIYLKRSLRNSGKMPDESKLNNEQKVQFEKLKGMAKQYEGKSDNEILKDLSQAVDKGKKDGTLTDEKINSIASTIAPMLNAEQRNKLNKLMQTIKK